MDFFTEQILVFQRDLVPATLSWIVKELQATGTTCAVPKSWTPIPAARGAVACVPAIWKFRKRPSEDQAAGDGEQYIHEC